jgi:multicomponent Na+:H+ antiporter subunit D
MNDFVSVIPLLTILVSLIATGFIIKTGQRNANLREFWSVAAGIIKFGLVASLLPSVLADTKIHYTLFTIAPGIEISFKADALSVLFALGAAFLWIVTTFYSIGYMRSLNEHAQTRYFACFAVSLSTTMGVAFSANLFTMFLFYEGLTIITYPLVYHKEDDVSRAGARKYVIYLLGAAKVFLIAAIVLTYNLAGTLEFRAGGIFPADVVASHPMLLSILFLMYLYGFAKCAVMPLHGWLPAAMVAPTPVSALLHAVAVVKTGVFTVLSVVFFVFGPNTLKVLGVNNVAVVIACFTLLMASIIALSRDNLKARLAFSTVSQLSYIILGAAMLTPSAIVGGISHITMHAFGKITLFFCAGSIYACAHKTEISELSGLGKKMPWTMAAFTIGAFNMIGVPLVGGFVSKWNLMVGAVETGSVTILAVLLVSSLLNAAYFMPIVYKAFFETPINSHAGSLCDNHHEEIHENPFMAIPLCFTAAMTFVLGIYPDFIMHLAQGVAR